VRRIVVALCVLLVVVAVIAEVPHKMFSATADSSQSDGKEAGDGKSPLVCPTNGRCVLRDRTISVTDGPAIVAKTNCEIHLTKMTLQGRVGIQAGNNVTITLDEVTIQADRAIDAETNVTIKLRRGSKLSGRSTGIVAGSNAKIRIDASTVEGKASAIAGGANLVLEAENKSRIIAVETAIASAVMAKINVRSAAR
jgi:hypothetical protein